MPSFSLTFVTLRKIECKLPIDSDREKEDKQMRAREDLSMTGTGFGTVLRTSSSSGKNKEPPNIMKELFPSYFYRLPESLEDDVCSMRANRYHRIAKDSRLTPSLEAWEWA